MIFTDKEVPSGVTAIAQLRLAVMDQNSPMLAVETFFKLPVSTQKFLSFEMARTGISDQSFAKCPVQGGPAFLVYYGPALLQRSSADPEQKLLAIRALAAVYRAGRALWPADAAHQGEVVTLEIAQLKSQDIKDVFS